jgi:tetratricopeptide (TPR) repeat protein
MALFVGLCLTIASPSPAADLQEAESAFRTGRYDDCIRRVSQELDNGARDEIWSVLKIKSELARGKYPAALETLEQAENRVPTSLALRLLGHEVHRRNGQDEVAASELKAIETLVRNAPYRYGNPESRVALGRYFLLRGADARKVLDQFYDVAKKQEPALIEVYLATAELALTKQDYALAADTLQKAPKAAAEEPRYHYLLACAFAPEDRGRSQKALADALKINPRHADSLLLKIDHWIDAERYSEAAQSLKEVLEINPLESRAFAYQAVLAHLENDQKSEAKARETALAHWKTNPEVEHLIGRKLAQKYRFAEGAALQRKALEVDPSYMPAKIQLCQDLLRLGEEAEGWKLAGEIFADDAYNVSAFNLTTLRDRLKGFRTLEADGLIVRMDAKEADLYGMRVLALLQRARKTLCEKYGVTIKEPVIVEIFPQRNEFAVRTFGLPGADGLLGVCFGRVITANSPASQGEHPSNWEAVLWHEFCHVVTLNKTRNKMPRWLSEGISVYEEEQQDPAWGSSLNPRFRKMILGDSLSPLSRLSSAFLAPESPLHLQFAYFESALAVQFLVEQFGLPALKAVLEDLGTGVAINDTLPRRTKKSLLELDRDFAQFARKRAESVAPSSTWEEPDLPAIADSEAWDAWVEKHPKNFSGLQRLAARLVTEQKWERAKEILQRLKALYPDYVGSENAYVLLATVYRKTSEKSAERVVLEELAKRDGSAGPAYVRLMELEEGDGDWNGVAKNAKRLMAVNPLIPTPHRQLGRAAEQLGNRDEAETAYRALGLLDDTDPADVHYRLAKLLRDGGKSTEARREVLKALEEAPRFREAHRLLLELTESGKSAASTRPAASRATGPKP